MYSEKRVLYADSLFLIAKNDKIRMLININKFVSDANTV